MTEDEANYLIGKAILAERLACAGVCTELAESHKRDVGGECDEDCDIVLGFETCAEQILERSGCVYPPSPFK